MTGSSIARTRAAAPLIAALIAMVAPNLAPPSAHAQLTVYDPSNYAQNVMTAARTLQQVNNQITALQNQAQMLSQQALHLKTLDYSALAPMRDALQQLNGLMSKADGIALNLRATETALGQMFDGLDPAATTGQTAARARDQAVAALEAYRRTLRVQAQVVENIQADAPLIADLVSQSQGSAGSLQAQQAANQLQALAIKQDQQLQSLMVAQYRADALERARQAQALEAGKLATRRFLGEGQAYTPR